MNLFLFFVLLQGLLVIGATSNENDLTLKLLSENLKHLLDSRSPVAEQLAFMQDEINGLKSDLRTVRSELSECQSRDHSRVPDNDHVMVHWLKETVMELKKEVEEERSRRPKTNENQFKFLAASMEQLRVEVQELRVKEEKDVAAMEKTPFNDISIHPRHHIRTKHQMESEVNRLNSLIIQLQQDLSTSTRRWEEKVHVISQQVDKCPSKRDFSDLANDTRRLYQSVHTLEDNLSKQRKTFETFQRKVEVDVLKLSSKLRTMEEAEASANSSVLRLSRDLSQEHGMWQADLARLLYLTTNLERKTQKMQQETDKSESVKKV